MLAGHHPKNVGLHGLRAQWSSRGGGGCVLAAIPKSLLEHRTRQPPKSGKVGGEGDRLRRPPSSRPTKQSEETQGSTTQRGKTKGSSPMGSSSNQRDRFSVLCLVASGSFEGYKKEESLRQIWTRRKDRVHSPRTAF